MNPRGREVFANIAGGITAVATYGTEAYVGYISAQMLAAFVQSPDQFTSTVGVLTTLVVAGTVLYDMAQNRGEFITGVITSGIRAGLGVRQAIIG